MTTIPIAAGAVRPGDELDWKALERHLSDRLGLAGPMSVRQFPHGAANLTYLVEFGATRLVVRRPPFGRLAPGAHDMHRESKVLSRLGDAWSRAPRCLLFCDDHDVIGADFFVMEFVEGIVIRGAEIPSPLADHDDVARRVSIALVDAIAEMHLIVPDEVGLGDLGKPAGFVERQVEGWWKRWQHVAAPSCDVMMGNVYEMLRTNIPHPQRSSIVHGDLKLNNCVFDPDDPDHVRAIFDWDMTTLGDPLIDLGALLSYWPAEGDEGRASRMLLPELQTLGLPARGELLARYADRTGIDVAAMDFYVGFAAWKTAIIVQQLVYRYRAGDSNNHRLAALADYPDIGAEAATAIMTRVAGARA